MTAMTAPATSAPWRPWERKAPGLPPLVMAYLVLMMLPIQVQVGPLFLTSLRVLLLAVTVPLLVRVLRGGAGGVLAADLLLVGHVAWVAVALARNNPGMLVQNAGANAVELLGGYLIARCYVRDLATLLALFRWLAAILALLLPLTLYEAVTGTSLILEALRALPGIGTEGNVNMPQRLGLNRVQGAFPHPIHFGVFASSAFALVFVGLSGQVSGAVRWLASLVILVSVAASLSSGALLAVVLQILLIGWWLLFRRRARPWWPLVALVVLAYVAVDLLSNRRPVDVFISYATFSSGTAYWRKLIFQFGMDNVWANPIFGLGFRDWIRPWFMVTSSVDNFWLVMAMRYGLPGFLLIAGGWAWGLWRVMRRDFSADPLLARARLAWVFVFLGLTFSLTTVHIWTTVYSYVFFLFGAGLWMIRHAPEAPGPQAPAASPAGPGPGPGPRSGARPAAGAPSPGPSPGPRFTRFPSRPGR